MSQAITETIGSFSWWMKCPKCGHFQSERNDLCGKCGAEGLYRAKIRERRTKVWTGFLSTNLELTIVFEELSSDGRLTELSRKTHEICGDM